MKRNLVLQALILLFPLFLCACGETASFSKPTASAVVAARPPNETISASNYCTYGVKSDGTAVRVGMDLYSFYGNGDVDDWTDIVAISVGGAYTVGLRSDGTAVVVGYSEHEECNIEHW